MLFFQNIFTNDDGFFFIQDCFSVILEDNLFLQCDISYKTYIMQNWDKNIKKVPNNVATIDKSFTSGK